MKIKFLGTAASEGWPALFCQCEVCKKARIIGGKNIRTRSSCLIDDKLMIDFPPDTYKHILDYNIDLGNVNHIIITHSHSDHFYPNDIIMRREPFAHLEKNDALNIYGNSNIIGCLKVLKQKENVDDEVVRLYEVYPYETYEAGVAYITPLLAKHDRNEKCFIYAIEIGGKKLLYGHDSGYFPEETFDYLKKHYFDCVILDCTTGLKKDCDVHMNIPDDYLVKQRLIEQKSADLNTLFIITHFSHNGGLLHDELVEAAGPKGFEVAFDGAEFYI